jgi:molybdopterin converting factor small subunit
MARVVLVGNLAQVTGGVAEFDLSATSVQQLFQQLTALHPALEPHLETGVAVAIDGQIYQDALFAPIQDDSEVFLLPQIAGGRQEPTANQRLPAAAQGPAAGQRLPAAEALRGEPKASRAH